MKSTNTKGSLDVTVGKGNFIFKLSISTMLLKAIIVVIAFMTLITIYAYASHMHKLSNDYERYVPNGYVVKTEEVIIKHGETMQGVVKDFMFKHGETAYYIPFKVECNNVDHVSLHKNNDGHYEKYCYKAGDTLIIPYIKKK